MMVIKSIIRGMRILQRQSRKVLITDGGSREDHELSVGMPNQSTAHLMIIPTPHGLPLIIPIYANEVTVRELIRDHYYVLP